MSRTLLVINHFSLQLLLYTCCSPRDLCFVQVQRLQVVFLINHINLEGFHFQNGNVVRPMSPKEAFGPLGLTSGPGFTIVKKMTCHTCLLAKSEKKLLWSSNADTAFISRGFSNWKDVRRNFRYTRLRYVMHGQKWRT